MRLIFLMFLMHFVSNAKSQEIALNYNTNYTGNNVQISFNPKYSIGKKASVFYGFKYHFNPKNLWDDENYASYKKYYAENLLQHIGIAVNFSYQISLKSNYKISVFVEAQNSYMARRYDNFVTYENTKDSSGNVYVLRLKYTRQPQYVLEINTGLAIEIKLTDNIRVLGALGIGGMYQTHTKGGEKVIEELSGNTILYGVDPEHPNSPDFDLISFQTKLGIVYSLNKSKKDGS